MDDIRWKEEREEIIELIYRVQVDHDNSLPESEVDELCPWVGAAHRKASRQLTSAYAS